MIDLVRFKKWSKHKFKDYVIFMYIWFFFFWFKWKISKYFQFKTSLSIYISSLNVIFEKSMLQHGLYYNLRKPRYSFFPLITRAWALGQDSNEWNMKMLHVICLALWYFQLSLMCYLFGNLSPLCSRKAFWFFFWFLGFFCVCSPLPYSSIWEMKIGK